MVVVDDNELLRAGPLVTVLTSDPDVEVVGQAADGPAGVRACREHTPDLVLMDIEMPGGDGHSATRRIVTERPEVRVLILTMFDLDDYVVEALRAGVAGFLLKTTPPRALIRAAHRCVAGETTVGPTVMARLVDSYVGHQEPPPPGVAELTDRERDVLRCLADGRSNAEIAGERFLAETTVKTHVARILAKLRGGDRVQAVVVAHRCGLAGG